MLIATSIFRGIQKHLKLIFQLLDREHELWGCHMDEAYCCSCAEVIWNPLPFEKIILQVREYIKKNYPQFVLREWNKKINSFISKKQESFDDVSFCPHCIVLYSLLFLKEITGKDDHKLKLFLCSLEGI